MRGGGASVFRFSLLFVAHWVSDSTCLGTLSGGFRFGYVLLGDCVVAQGEQEVLSPGWKIGSSVIAVSGMMVS